jgi:hypothetical protein
MEDLNTSSPAEISLVHERKILVSCETAESIIKMGVKIISCVGRLLTEKMSIKHKNCFGSAGAIIGDQLEIVPNVFEFQLIRLKRVHAHARMNRFGKHKVHRCFRT